MNSLVDLLDSVRAHLAEFELPALWSVDVTASAAEPKVYVQLDCDQPPAVAGALLAWADTLSEITFAAWRVPSGDSVHLSVLGCLSDGATVLVYGAVSFARLDVGADLAPNAHITVPLAALRAMATPSEAIA